MAREGLSRTVAPWWLLSYQADDRTRYAYFDDETSCASAARDLANAGYRVTWGPAGVRPLEPLQHPRAG